MKKTIENLVKEALGSIGASEARFTVEHPTNLNFGDYTTNAGIVSKKASELLDYLLSHKPAEIENIEIKAGFINFYLSKEFFKKSIGGIIEKGGGFGKNERLKGERVMVEHTDPNPFKEFHIGHLMSNAIGESISKIIEWNGAEVKRACYQGDVGLHVAKAIWFVMNQDKRLADKEPILKQENIIYDWEDLVKGKAYTFGNKAYEADENAKKEIIEINKKIYDRSEEKINIRYDQGRKASLEYFDSIYKKLGSEFDFKLFESETWNIGRKLVMENLGEVFEKSDGAIVFLGEKYNEHLHTRVFINSEGLPTYEAKELGLAKIKSEKYACTKSIVITGNEIKDYFRVVLEAMKLIFPELAEKTLHLSHGMLRLSTGKMSSRTGDVITAESLIDEVKEKTKNDEAVAIGAIKYMILRQSIGNDIIFDIEKSVSTEGDSGVYLQYAYARTCSILEKANSKGDASGERKEIHEVEKLLYRFPEIVERASKEYSPNLLTTYLTEIAGSFNNLYASEQIISDKPESVYLVALTRAFNTVMKNGLTILGIPAPERM